MQVSLLQKETEDQVREKDEVIESLELKIVDLEEQVQVLFNEFQRSGEMSTANDEVIHGLQNELTATKKQYSDERKVLEEKQNSEIHILKQQIVSLKDRNLYLETNLEKSNTKCIAAEQRLAVFEKKPGYVKSMPLR
jgi:chromosome segregation ATPase